MTNDDVQYSVYIHVYIVRKWTIDSPMCIWKQYTNLLHIKL